MSGVIEAFLKTDELDQLLKLRSQIEKLAPEEDQAILSILESWSDEQAIANLLFYPNLISAACRERFVLKGLCDFENPYFVLATVVGLDSLAVSGVSAEMRSEIVRRLIAFCADYSDVLGERSSVSLRAFLAKEDLPSLLPLLGVQNDVVRENIVGWIAKSCDGIAPQQMVEEFRVFGLSWFQRRRVLSAIHKFTVKRSGVVEAFKTAPLLSYIPNLKEAKA